MQRHASYSCPQMAPTTHRYSGTSSAFSPSANPNEDWTKISDLAERRRIQNRIAQRNYRKKLKKRLEDLERRANSSSASPEQQPAELNRSDSQHSESGRSDAVKNTYQQPQQDRRATKAASNQYYSAQEDSSLFAHQYTRQLSTSPPPFSYSTYPTYSQPASYSSMSFSTSSDFPLYAPCAPSLQSTNYPVTLPSVGHPVKQEYFAEDEFSPFSMSYASMAGIDIPLSQQPYQESHIHTPPLSHSFDPSVAGSPPDSAMFPTTPGSIPTTPHLHFM